MPHPLLLKDSKGSKLMCKKYKEFQGGIFGGGGCGLVLRQNKDNGVVRLGPSLHQSLHHSISQSQLAFDPPGIVHHVHT